MAASDYIESVYQDAVFSFQNASAYADIITGFQYRPEVFSLRLVNDVTDPTTFNVTYAHDAAPTISTPSVSTSTLPTFDSSIVNISSFSEIAVPDFMAIAPELSFPTAVTLSNPTLPNTKPVLDNIAVPDAPTFTMPTLPTLATVVVPDDVNVVIPTFDFTFNLPRPTAPTNTFSFIEQQYTSPLLTAALELLEEDVLNGGYGLRPEDELNLWNRAKDRISKATEEEIDQAEGNISARGFTLPTGAQNALIAKATQNKTAQLSQVNNEIAIKRADMYVQARQFAVTTGLNAQQFLLSYHGSVQERTLNASKMVADFGIMYFEANVKDFQNGLEQYKTEASVFQTKLQVAREQTEIFRTRLESARLKGQINQDAIELYNAQFRAVEAVTNIYNIQLQSARVKAELQELQYRVYAQEINAFTAQIEADGQRVQNYRTIVETETAKIDAFKAQVQAHNALLDGAKTRNDIQNSKIRAEIEASELKLRGFATQLDRWGKEYDVALSNAKIVLDKHGVDLDAWKAKNTFALNTDELKQKNHGQNVQNLINARSFNVDKYKTNINTFLQTFDGISKNYTNAGELNARLAAASYSALNTIAAVIE